MAVESLNAMRGTAVGCLFRQEMPDFSGMHLAVDPRGVAFRMLREAAREMYDG